MNENNLSVGYFEPKLDFVLQEFSPLELQEITGGDDIAWWTGYIVGQVKNGFDQVVNGAEWAWMTGGASYQGMYVSYSNS